MAYRMFATGSVEIRTAVTWVLRTTALAGRLCMPCGLIAKLSGSAGCCDDGGAPNGSPQHAWHISTPDSRHHYKCSSNEAWGRAYRVRRCTNEIISGHGLYRKIAAGRQSTKYCAAMDNGNL